MGEMFCTSLKLLSASVEVVILGGPELKDKREWSVCLLLLISHLANIRYTDEALRDEQEQTHCSVEGTLREPIWKDLWL